MDLKNLKKLISLTFDSNPEIRMQAAIKLGEVDDPGATFALLELSYDKDDKVAQTAREILKRKSKNEPKLMSFAEVFKNNEEKEKPKEYKKMLEPIERILEKSLGKDRASKLKNKIMPQIIKSSEKEKQKQGKGIMQEVLLAYLEEIGVQSLEKPKSKDKDEIQQISSTNENAVIMEKEIEEARSDKYFTVEHKSDEEELDNSMKPVFQLALNTFLESENEAIMKKQMENIKKFFNKQIEIAFKIAKDRLKKRKIVHITNIKDGMRRIYTDLLTIKSINKVSFQKSKRKREVITRVVVVDSEGDEGVIYLLDNRGEGLKEGMKVRVEEGRAKYFAFSGETAIVIAKSGKLIAEF